MTNKTIRDLDTAELRRMRSNYKQKAKRRRETIRVLSAELWQFENGVSIITREIERRKCQNGPSDNPPPD